MLHRNQRAARRGLFDLVAGKRGQVLPSGELMMAAEDVAAASMVNAWGLRCLTNETLSMWAGKQSVERTLLLVPVRIVATRAYIENLGHWLSGIFLPILVQMWNSPGPALPVVLHSCSHNRVGRRCGFATVPSALLGGVDRLGGASEAAGLPWIFTLLRQHRPTSYTGAWNVRVACEACSPQEWLPRYVPLLRTWIGLSYPQYSLLHHQSVPEAPTKNLLLLQRMPHGTRWIENLDHLSALSERHGWTSQVQRVDTKCSYSDLLSAFMYKADVVAGFNGADLGIAAVLQRPGTVMMELIDSSYAYVDGWEIFQGHLGANLKVMRLIIPHDTIHYIKFHDGLPEVTQRAFHRLRLSAPDCYPEANQTVGFMYRGCWRFVPGVINVPDEVWLQTLAAAEKLRAVSTPVNRGFSPVNPWDVVDTHGGGGGKQGGGRMSMRGGHMRRSGGQRQQRSATRNRR
eukprot:TRINITY_DN12601_c0_g1_i2.p1 TRINITY_DN12601_c0_g1~~TRINITY_DN12601_c0_g1_i2.p1  ORF type:complete len:458 (+),score=48.12 TRINITY_DN12601_c0_g1_i2:849-2222(+)